MRARAEAVAAVRPQLEAIAGRLFDVGNEPGLAQVCKLVNNAISAAGMIAACEATVLGVKAGLDAGTMLDAINAGSGRNAATLDKFPKSILTGTFDYGGPLGLMLKDLGLFIEEAQAHGVRSLLAAGHAEGLAGSRGPRGPAGRLQHGDPAHGAGRRGASAAAHGQGLRRTKRWTTESGARLPSSPARRAASAPPPRGCSRGRARTSRCSTATSAGAEQLAARTARRRAGDAPAGALDVPRRAGRSPPPSPRTESELGGVDFIVNVAGGGSRQTLATMSHEDWHAIVDLNLTGPFNAIRRRTPRCAGVAAAPSSRWARWRRLRMSMNNGVSYTAAKAGVLGLTRHAAFELGRDNIRVNAVLPGPVLTPQMKAKISRRDARRGPRELPLGRWVQPEEVAAPILFFCSAMASACTGTHVVIDCGLHVGAHQSRARSTTARATSRRGRLKLPATSGSPVLKRKKCRRN